MIRRTPPRYRPRVDRLDDRCLLSGLSAGLSPNQLTQAYGLNSVSLQSVNGAIKGDGTGQTIAIVDAFHDPNLASDLNTFDTAYGLPAAKLTQTDLAGNTTNDGWAGEETLDVEYAHALAPGANIVVVEAKTDGLNDMLSAVDVARSTPGVNIVSMSWGGSEFAGETSLDYHFTTPAGHIPITFVAASGDNSAYAGAEWPATSPNVVAVGGTSLYIGAGGGYGGESAWGYGGGGYSAFEPEPSYQSGVQSTGVKSTPDVAMDAGTGIETYTTTPSDGVGTWQSVGGTSASTVEFAAALAVADEGRALIGQPSLGSGTTLATLYADNGTSAFNSITTGSNGYRATAGYNLATGLGSPNGQAFVNSLVSNVPKATAPPVVAAPVSHRKVRRTVRARPKLDEGGDGSTGASANSGAVANSGGVATTPTNSPTPVTTTTTTATGTTTTTATTSTAAAQGATTPSAQAASTATAQLAIALNAASVLSPIALIPDTTSSATAMHTTAASAVSVTATPAAVIPQQVQVTPSGDSPAGPIGFFAAPRPNRDVDAAQPVAAPADAAAPAAGRNAVTPFGWTGRLGELLFGREGSADAAKGADEAAPAAPVERPAKPDSDPKGDDEASATSPTGAFAAIAIAALVSRDQIRRWSRSTLRRKGPALAFTPGGTSPITA